MFALFYIRQNKILFKIPVKVEANSDEGKKKFKTNKQVKTPMPHSAFVIQMKKDMEGRQAQVHNKLWLCLLT